MRTPHITDEIIDAIIQNEGRHLEHPRAQRASAWVPARRPAAPPGPGPERAPRLAGEDPDPCRPA
jgi:hypothetical protein